jgi:hypothetical protein
VVVLLGALLLLAGASTPLSIGVAQPTPRRPARTPDPLVAVADADPLELARVAAQLGDLAVIARLDRRQPVVVRLAAVRATPFLAGPERALPLLAEMARGRDPHLAPAAADALLRITAALDGAALDRREVLRPELTPARASLRTLIDDHTARPDIRRAALLADSSLAALGVPGST